jgi:hypothetical protein
LGPKYNQKAIIEEGEAYPSAILISVFEFLTAGGKGSFDRGIQLASGYTGLIVRREVLQIKCESGPQRWLENNTQ